MVFYQPFEALSTIPTWQQKKSCFWKLISWPRLKAYHYKATDVHSCSYNLCCFQTINCLPQEENEEWCGNIMKTVGRRQMGTQKDGPLQAPVHRIQLRAAQPSSMPRLPWGLPVSLSFFLISWCTGLHPEQTAVWSKFLNSFLGNQSSLSLSLTSD